MGISLKPQHLNRYSQIAWLFMKYGRSDLVKSAGLEETLEAEQRGGGVVLLINILFYDKSGRD